MAALEGKEKAETAGLGADAPKENEGLGADAEAEAEFEASAMLANGFALAFGSSPPFFDAGDIDMAFGLARFAKGLGESAGLDAGTVEADDAPRDPLSAPYFRLDTFTIFRRCITSLLARVIP